MLNAAAGLPAAACCLQQCVDQQQEGDDAPASSSLTQVDSSTKYIEHTICETQVNPFTAQADAEQAQQQLLSTGLLAEDAAGNQFLREMLQTYGAVQQLYHKALRPLLERHAAYVDSPAGE